MGNTPSSSKPTTPSSTHAHSHSQSLDSSKPLRGDNKLPIPVPNLSQKVAAPAEASLAQAQGSTTVGSHRHRPFHPRQSDSLNSSSPSTSSPGGSIQTSKAPSEVGKASAPAHPKHEHSQPVDVPHISKHDSHESDDAGFSDPAQFSNSGRINSKSEMAYVNRPPRLPLPIEEEVHTPGSPIITPADISEPVGDVDPLDTEALDRKASVLSTGSEEEEDVEELRVDKTRPTVPTRLEWRHGGKRVYVTGTIFQWNRKTRLHPIEGRPEGEYGATIHILPGTHHIRFLVDNQMMTSPDLPTTVDFGNNLVNYIEVSADGATTPGVDAAAAAQPLAAGALSPEPQEEEAEPDKQPRGKIIKPKTEFTSTIPKYLLDFDQPEDSARYSRAVPAIEKLPNPPSLPGFLGKPILNAAVLIKDDNSVLNMPNHTVLNHLATSSIKNNVLAVSATTRYKSKYVTTVIYKPTSTDE